MRDFIYWIIKMENMARSLYEEAADIFSEDERFADFLRQLSIEEAGHADLMETALECTEDSDFSAPVIIDLETMSRIESPIIIARQKIGSKMITKEDLINTIIEAEFSEWNPLFLYTIYFVYKKKKCCPDAAANIQKHEKRIRKYIEALPDCHIYMDRFKHLPVVWREKILIVDDDPLVAELLRSIFEHDNFSVETAFTGKEALARMGHEYFDVIVSDIAMPEMNGIEFFEESKKIWPDIGQRFLFYSGDISSGEIEVFEKIEVQYMRKPMPVNEIRENVFKILHRQ